MRWKKKLQIGWIRPQDKKLKNRRPTYSSSYFGQCLLNLQRLKSIYNCTTKRLKKVAKDSMRKGLASSPSEEFIGDLESRVSVVLWRSGLAKTIGHAMQMVSHKHVLLNGRRINRNFIKLKKGDIFTVSTGSGMVEPDSEYKAPSYIKVLNNEISLIKKPALNEVPINLEIDFNKVFNFLLN